MPTPRRVPTPCAIEGCEKESRYSTGWCPMHHARWKRHGDPLTLLIGNGTVRRRLQSEGYWSAYDPTHPLAGPSGNVYEHRAALHDHIGPGWHPCHYCSTPVSWDLRWPKHRRALTVDHVDGVKVNNEPANLVPSCGPCNSKEQAKRLFDQDKCRRGHEVNEVNTYTTPGTGKRQCRVCRRLHRSDIAPDRRNIYGARRKAA